jgi:hypothetical protein
LAGISNHSCLPIVLEVRKNGHRSVNIDNEVSASASEIGVLEDLTMTSATSDNGIVLRRVRGGVVMEAEEDEPGAENNLSWSALLRFTEHGSLHPNTLGNAFQPTERTSPLELLLLGSSRHVDFVATVYRRSKSRHRTL